MTKILSLCIFVFVAVSVGSPQAEDHSRGNYLLTSCQLAVKVLDGQDAKAFEEALKLGYCEGIIHGVSFTSAKMCLGANVTHVQLMRVVVKYLQDHPEELNQIDADLVEKALAKAFPCKSPG